MVSLLAVLGRHRTLLTSTDSIYGEGGLHAQDSNGEPWRQGPHIAKSRLKAADNLGEEEV